MKPYTIDSFNNETILTVTVGKRLEWRIKTGLLFIRLGCWIATIGYKAEHEE